MLAENLRDHAMCVPGVDPEPQICTVVAHAGEGEACSCKITFFVVRAACGIMVKL